MKFVAITACPTGIAHTYMAAESLEQIARDNGHELVVETQGSAGSDPLTAQQIAEADAVIFAVDVAVSGRERFAGKPIIEVPIKAAINDAQSLLDQAIAAAEHAPGDHKGPPVVEKVKEGRVTTVRQWLMTGVSYMIPFVAAGGLLIALSFAIGGYGIANVKFDPTTFSFNPGSSHDWALIMFQVGSTAFKFLVPVLAGFIAFAIADRPALAPGFVGGAIAVLVQAGFLGGLVAGLLGGAVVLLLKKVKVPRAVAGLMPVVIYPLLGTVIVGFLMFVVVGKPIAAAMSGLTHWLNGLSGSNAILLGLLLGAMMAFDLGGPVNKVAYTFATLNLANGTTGGFQVMAAVMAAGMVPPLAMALSTTIRKGLFTEAERENGRAAWLLGASFISEGAIPFAASDPLRVIPSSMVGAAITGGLSMAFGVTLRAPHGGIFVVPLMGHALFFLVALAVGTVVSALIVIVLKTAGQKKAAQAAAIPAGA
jgi:PTS system fructose-specific IIC component